MHIVPTLHSKNTFYKSLEVAGLFAMENTHHQQRRAVDDNAVRLADHRKLGVRVSLMGAQEEATE